MRRLVVICILLLFIGHINAQVVENPVFDRTDTPEFHIMKIKLTKDTTYVFCSYYAESGCWANISKETYLYDRKANKKYPLLRCDGLPYSPQQKTFEYAERCDVILCFPSFLNASKFDIIENESKKAFNIYGVDISNTYETSYKESDLARFSNMASFYDSAGDTIKALQYKEKEIEATKYVFGVKSEPLIVSLFNASIMYDKFGYSEQAIDIAKQEGVIHAELWGTSNWNYALYLRALGRFYSHAKEHVSAIELYKKSIQLFESLNIVDNEYALALFFIAEVYCEIGDSDNALIYQRKSLEARRIIGDADKYLNELICILLSTNDVYGLFERIDIVKKELDSLPDFVNRSSVLIATVQKWIAKKYYIVDNYLNAIKYCDIALSTLYNIGDSTSEEYAEILSLKCKYQQANGQESDAIVSGLKAKMLYDSLNVKSLIYAELLSDLSCAYGMVYNYEESVRLQKIAIAIFDELEEWISLSEGYSRISNYYRNVEDSEKAEFYIKKAIDTLNKHDDAQQIVASLAEAQTNPLIIKQSTLALVDQRINYNKSNYLQILASIYQKENKMSDAISVEKESGVILMDMGDEESYANHLISLSVYYLEDKQYDNAINCVEQCMQILSKHRWLSLALPKMLQSKIFYEKGDIEKAIIYARTAISLSELSDEIDCKTTAQSVLSNYYLKNHNIPKAEENMSELLDFLKEKISSEVEEMNITQKQRMWNKYENNFLMYRNIIENSNRDAALLSKLYNYILFSKSLLLDTEIQKIVDGFERLRVRWEDIQQQLSDRDVAIEFISTAEDSIYNTYHALIVDKNRTSPQMITLYKESDLEIIKQTNTQNIIDIVGNLIWRPIMKQYKEVENIYFSPDGIINILPIENSIVDGVGEMMEHYNLYRLSSTKEIVFRNKELSPNNAILYGGLDYDMFTKEATNSTNEKKYSLLRGINARGGFDPLMSTIEEVNEISDLLKNRKISTTLYTGVDGTEDSFKNLSGKNVNMLHLSTHGMYVGPNNVEQKRKENNFKFLELITNEKDPVKEDIVLTHSFLVMSGGNSLSRHEIAGSGMNDGILTAFEISKTDLSKVDLVVLSACETGLGDIDNGGVYGLQRGFKKAGVNTILMSLDKVDDEATKILMVEFYKNLMSGKTKYQSLRNAQKYLRTVENGKYDDPKYWASFIMLDGLN